MVRSGPPAEPPVAASEVEDSSVGDGADHCKKGGPLGGGGEAVEGAGEEGVGGEEGRVGVDGRGHGCGGEGKNGDVCAGCW